MTNKKFISTLLLLLFFVAVIGGAGCGGGSSSSPSSEEQSDSNPTQEINTTFTVDFNSNGGSSVASQNIVAGKQAVEPVKPTLEGYTFQGWYTDEALTERFLFTTIITQNMTLYAKWEIQVEPVVMYSVIFDSYGGSEVAMQEVEEEDLVEKPEDPKLDGYVFVAWLDEDGEIFDFNSPIYENRTLVADWLELDEATDIELTEIKNVVFGGKVQLQLDSPDFAPLTDVEVTYDFVDTAGIVEISPLTDSPILGTAGLIGLPVNIKSDISDFEKTTITFHYDPELLSVSPNDLGIVWYDEENDQIVLLSRDVVIDTSSNAIQFTADHFSIYGLVSVSQWNAIWSKRVSKVRSSDVNYNVILILDISYSMYGQPIRDAIDSTKNLIEALDDDDYASVIYFSDEVKEVVPTTKIENNKAAIKNAIYMPSYYEMNGTNILSALTLSLNYNKTDVTNLVVLLSDGYGYSNAVYDSVLRQLKDNNMKVITVGLGGSVDTELLERIANATNGGYVYVSDSEGLNDKFEEIANVDLGVNDTDDDHDGLPDALEKSGLKDLFQHEWKTDPTSPDTDGDGILDGDEIKFTSNSYFSNVRYISNPLLYTKSEDKPRVSIPNKVYCTVDDLNSRRLTLKFPITSSLYRKYSDREVFYPDVKTNGLSYTVFDLPEGFTSTGNVSITKGTTKKTDDGTQESEIVYWATFSVTYPVDQSRALKAVNIRDNNPHDTKTWIWIDVPVTYVNTQIRSQAVERSERAYQNLEKQYIQALLKAIQDVQEDDSEIKDTSESLQIIAKEITAISNNPKTTGSVPQEVYQAVAEAIAKAIKESAVTEYNMSLEDLIKKPMNFITGFMKEWAKGIENIHQKSIKTVTVGGTNYTVEVMTTTYAGVGYVDGGYVRTGQKEWKLMPWGMNNKQLNKTLGNYCAVLLQLSESIVEEFWSIYINSFLSETGSTKKVSQAMVHNAGLVIKVLCGGKTGEEAAKELATVTIQYAKSKAQEILKQRLQTIDAQQFMIEIDNLVKNLPDGNGKKFKDIAPRLNKIAEKYESLRKALEAYKSFSRGSGGSVSQAISDVEKAYKGFKSVYDDLNDESIFTSKEALIDIIFPK